MNGFWMPLLIAIYFSKTNDSHRGECTFDEDSDSCEYLQDTNDDLDWQLIRNHGSSLQTVDHLLGSYVMVNSSEHSAGRKAHLIIPSFSENETHCIQFNYFLYSRDGHNPGSLNVYIKSNLGATGSPVWNVTGFHGQQWLHAELSVGIFWPDEYQVIFEVVVSTEQRGCIGIDNILTMNFPCYEAPHFLNLGDVEVNSGQIATFQCIAIMHTPEIETVFLQRQHRGITKPVSWLRNNSSDITATFELHEVTKQEQDLYQCVTQSAKGSAVSNYAKLIVREPPSPVAPPRLIHAGLTYLVIQLNTNITSGDGPVIQREIEYRMNSQSQSKIQIAPYLIHMLRHLYLDTEYVIRVLLTRPGEGGRGNPGPSLICKTKCAEPLRAPKELTFSEIQSRNITLQWEQLKIDIVRCFTYSISVCYRYSIGAGHDQVVSYCKQAEPKVPRFTIKNLPPFTIIYVKVKLTNTEGSKRTKEYECRTDEDVPDKIPAESIFGIPGEHTIYLQWDEPLEPNGYITHYKVSYQSTESSDPAVIVPSLLNPQLKSKNEQYHRFVNLKPGTTYRFSVSASTSKGFGPETYTEITTNISAAHGKHKGPKWDFIFISCAGGLAVFILISGVIFVFVKKRKCMWQMNTVDTRSTVQSTVQEDERCGMTFIEYDCCIKCIKSQKGKQCKIRNERSILSGSFIWITLADRVRPGCPNQINQLQPAIQEADFPQHVNQMKKVESHGFKQEYENSFLDQTLCFERSKRDHK